MPSAVSEVTELQRAQLKFQRLLESTEAIPWEADAKTWRFTYVGCQAKEILGYPVDSWYEPEFWPQHIHPDDKEFAVTFCETSSREKSDYDFEYRMQHADGHYFEAMDGSPMLVGTDLVRYCDYRRLISHICLRKAEEQLQKRERAFGFTIAFIDEVPISVSLKACEA